MLFVRFISQWPGPHSHGYGSPIGGVGGRRGRSRCGRHGGWPYGHRLFGADVGARGGVYGHGHGDCDPRVYRGKT